MSKRLIKCHAETSGIPIECGVKQGPISKCGDFQTCMITFERTGHLTYQDVIISFIFKVKTIG